MLITNLLLAAILVFTILQWIDTNPLVVRRIKRALKLGVYRERK
jgi:hypothetical protein